LERALAWGQPFALVLLDAKMPDIDGLMVVGQIKQNPSIKSPIILMLSPSGQMEEAARCRELGVSNFLTKPARQSDLLDAIMGATGVKAVQKISAKRLRPRESRHPRRILLTEDHPVNQRLAIKLLEKWGHSVVVASNGRKALEALEREKFDLILMDLQMPEMGGLEATARIRDNERATFQRRIPIVAMTAHAMKADREGCARAGMDGYVAKPLDPEILFDTIEGITANVTSLEEPIILPPEPSESTSSLPNNEPGPGPTTSGTVIPFVPSPAAPLRARRLDRQAILARVEGDTDLLKEVTNLFLEDAPRLMAEIKCSVEQKDAQALARTAHALKGSIGNFGAAAAFDATLQLETMGRRNELEGASEMFERLQKEINEVLPELQTLIQMEAA
jgi:CheY-like chemotaxis protein